MTIINKETLGIKSFLEMFYTDLANKTATGWWNERLQRRGERLSIKHRDVLLNTLYDLVEYIKDSSESLTEADIKDLSDQVIRSYPILQSQRSYLWEVDEEAEVEKEEVLQEDIEEESQEETSVPDSSESEESEQEEPKEETPVPDFEYAKTIEDKQELKAYAKTFGFKIDSRKSLGDMMKSFQGKFHASKGK